MCIVHCITISIDHRVRICLSIMQINIDHPNVLEPIAVYIAKVHTAQLAAKTMQRKEPDSETHND